MHHFAAHHPHVTWAIMYLAGFVTPLIIEGAIELVAVFTNPE